MAPPEDPASNRTLTDADVDAILKKVEERVYRDLGKGVWGLFWKAAVIAIVAVAAAGYVKGMK